MATAARRVIEVRQQIIGPTEPRRKTVRPTRPGDYPHVPRAHLDLARKLASPLLMGPPLCDELVAFVEHLVTEEEAGVMRRLGMFRGRSAAAVARASIGRRSRSSRCLIVWPRRSGSS